MKKTKMNRTFWFRMATILLLLIIAGVMMIIGRGHTLYFANMTIEYNGVEYKAFQEVCINMKNTEEQYLYARERGMGNIMGQTAIVSFDIIPRKGSMASESHTEKFTVPYNMDGVVINLPAYFAGLPQEVWMTEFVSLATTSDSAADEVVVTDEFSAGLGL
ncbi:MAG: hypothetical protein KBS81_04350 [Spirochaetales bacterium]|nr:hypothetical protein [Candidatus Physcosoma equi]